MGFWNSWQVAEELYSLQAKCHLSFREPQALKTHKPSADRSKKQSFLSVTSNFDQERAHVPGFSATVPLPANFFLNAFNPLDIVKVFWPFVCGNLTWIEPSVPPGSFCHQRNQEWRFGVADTIPDSISYGNGLWKALQDKEGDGENPGTECSWCECLKREATESFEGFLTGWVWHHRISFLSRFWQHVHRMVI